MYIMQQFTSNSMITFYSTCKIVRFSLDNISLNSYTDYAPEKFHFYIKEKRYERKNLFNKERKPFIIKLKAGEVYLTIFKVKRRSNINSLHLKDVKVGQESFK